MFEFRTGRVTHTLADGSRYEDCDPIPCEREAYLYLDQAGEPYGLMVDGKGYRIKRSPRLRVPTRATLISLGKRIRPE
jgi:hypothetical protein